MSKAPRTRWGPVRSLLCLAPLFLLAPYYAYREHYGQSRPPHIRPASNTDIPLQRCPHLSSTCKYPLCISSSRMYACNVIDPRIDPVTSLPQLSEAQVLAHAKYLSEDIGYRTVGSREHALGDAWMLRQAEEVRAQCEAAVQAVPGRKLECEVWHQKGSGHHRYVFIAVTTPDLLKDTNTRLALRWSVSTPECRMLTLCVG